MRVEVDIEDITWECGDCGNRYEYGVSYCPNSKLDHWILNERLMEGLKTAKPKKKKKDKNSYEGTAYCVKCKELREFEGTIKTSDSGRRIAMGKCDECGTKLNRILGKDQ